MKSVPFDVAFKAIVGCAIGLLLVVGTVFFLAGANFTLTEQIGVAVFGGIVGWFAAKRVVHISARRSRGSWTGEPL